MADAPASENRRTWAFHEQLAELPERVRQLAVKCFALFLESPQHPSLRLHKLDDTKKSRHREGSYSVSITMAYRAIFIPVDGVNVWYWIGTHADYNDFVDA